MRSPGAGAGGAGTSTSGGGGYEYVSQYSITGAGGSTRSQPSAGWMNTLSNRSTASKRSSGTAGSQGQYR